MSSSKTRGRASGFASAVPWGALLLGVLLAGCAAPPPPARPEPERQARRIDREPKRLEPLHVAPPPEYGNKVVLATRSAEPSNF